MPGVFKVRWRNALLCRPAASGVYVVELSGTQPNGAAVQRIYTVGKGWNTIHTGELVLYWLDGLITTQEARTRGLLST